MEKNLVEVYRELMEMLRKRHPELIPLYENRYIYATSPETPPIMREHNAIEIYKAYLSLKLSEK